jgi:hypothetical protein
VNPRTHASFLLAAPFAPAPGAEQAPEGEPPGRDLAGFLAARIGARGMPCTAVEFLGFAFGFRCAVDRRSFYVTVGLVDDEEGEWLLVIDPSLGLFGRLLGAGDRTEHARLAEAIHAVLGGSGRFERIRWYDERQWDADPPTEWSDLPTSSTKDTKDTSQ